MYDMTDACRMDLDEFLVIVVENGIPSRIPFDNIFTENSTKNPTKFNLVMHDSTACSKAQKRMFAVQSMISMIAAVFYGILLLWMADR